MCNCESAFLIMSLAPNKSSMWMQSPGSRWGGGQWLSPHTWQILCDPNSADGVSLPWVVEAGLPTLLDVQWSKTFCKTTEVLLYLAM
jgi:hypothetical protein